MTQAAIHTAVKAKYEKMFQDRLAANPAAFTLEYWQNHFATSALASLDLQGCVLDVGCGTGEIDIWLARKFPGANIAGADISATAIHAANQHRERETPGVRERLRFQETDFSRLAFPDQSVDWCLLSHVLEHLTHPAGLFREMARVLKPGGKIAVVVPRGRFHDDPDHCRHLEPEEWARLASLYGTVEACWTSPDGQQVAMVLAPRRSFSVVAMMRVRNEETFLERTLAAAAPLADAFVILDDGSTDRTPQICQSHPKVKRYQRQEASAVDEVRDKNLLLKLAWELDADWILALDGDEEIEAGGAEYLRREIERCPPEIGIFEFDFPYFWNDEQHVRFDGPYAEVTRHPRLFRARGQAGAGLRFEASGHGAGFHCGSLPQGLQGHTQYSPVRFKHYGYLRPEQRQQKYDFYVRHDPAGARQGYYEHLVNQDNMILLPWQDRAAALCQAVEKTGDYYQHDRQDVLALVPPDARRILELGCASGRLGRALKQQRICYLAGVELNPDAAREALIHFDQVVVGDAEAADLPFADGLFDCLICADVLEHLRDPWAVLRRLIRFLKPGGAIVCSIPNIRHLAVLSDLAQGYWNYQDAGILDRTHLRFFTRQTFEQLLRSAGFNVEKIQLVKDSTFKDYSFPPDADKINLALGRMELHSLSAEEFTELTALQFLFLGRLPAEAASRNQTVARAVSIVIPVYNKAEYTQACLVALAQNTPENLFDLVVVDNASRDATPDLLQGLSGDVTVVTNRENAGFVKACNQGAQASASCYILFLNNDTLPQPGWLDAMLRLMKSSDRIGAVGAKLVYPDGTLQEAGGLIFSDASGWNFGRHDDPSRPEYNRACEVDYASGACLLVRRDLFERLGGFDMRYAPAYYEDTDLCFGIRKLGYQVWYCPEAVVVHNEGVTAGTRLDSGFKRYQAVNRTKFMEKWRTELQRQDAPPARPPVTADRHRRFGAPAPAAVSPVLRELKGLNILMIDPLLPTHDRSSGALRLFTIIKILRSFGCHITFIARNGLRLENYKRELEDMGVLVYATDPDKLVEKGLRLTGHPKIDMRAILAERHYHLAWLSFYEIAEQYLPEIREYSPGTRVAVDTVDVHYLRERRQAELLGDEKIAIQAEKTRARELAIYGRADDLIMVTANDRQVLEPDLPNQHYAVISNAHATAAQTPDFAGRAGLVFVANFQHPPNADAILHFCEKIFPLVRARIPGVKLTIIGSYPTEAVKALESECITVTGYVFDTAPFLDKSRVSIAPLRFGAGMKGKVGEAMSRALPVVTTGIGAEGMGLADGEHVLIADEPAAFAEAVVRAYTDEALWNKLSRQGREFIDRHYGVPAVAGRLQAYLEPLLSAAAAVPPPALTSIIMLAHNQLEYTRLCLESLRKHTPRPFEVIVVDNHSTDGTADYLECLQREWEPAADGAGCRRVHVIRNPENLGFAAGNNQGLAAARGDYLVLANNDVVFTAGWLERMIEVAEQSPAAGLVGPMSNYVSGPQKVAKTGYDAATLIGLEDYARRFRRERRGQCRPFWRVVGFCMLVKRAVIDKIGGLDSRFGLGNFEDDDFSLRASLAGFQSWIAEDVFIHHFGSRTFAGAAIDYQQSMKHNWQVFKQKWNLPPELDPGSIANLTSAVKTGFTPECYCQLE